MRSIAIVLIIASLSISTNAQNAQIGIRFGLTDSNFKGDSSDYFSARIMYHIGISGAYHFSEKISLQAEAIYSRQGAEYSVLNDKEGVFKYDYLQVPITFRYRFFKFFGLEAGSQIGFNVGNRYTLGENNLRNDNLNSPIVSLAIGANVNLGPDMIMSARFHPSFTTVESNGKFKNPFMTFSYTIYLGGESQFDL